MPRPNILFIHSDQHRYDCVGANGHPLFQTPHLDRLTREGVNFSHAFTPIAVCTPARASLLTGMWPSQHGALTIYGLAEYNRCTMQSDLPMWSGLLSENGYALGYVGKWHVHPTLSPLDCGFHDFVPEDAYFDWRKQQNLPPRPPLDFLNHWDGALDPIEAEQSRLAWGANETIRLLNDYSKRDQPFFLRWDPSEPHLPNLVPEPFASMYDPDEIAPWPSFPDSLENKPFAQTQMRRNWNVENWEWQQWAPIVARYGGEISLLDAQIGRILDALEASGLARNTLVVYSTDHGDFCGGHGMVDKHCAIYDDILRVPLMMRWPAILPAGERCDAFVCHEIDLASTFCDAAGIKAPETFVGHSLLGVVRGEDSAPREDVFSVYHGCQFGGGSARMVRDRRWKYVWNPLAEDELYDIENDEGEIVNRASDDSCRAELERLRGRLLEWMERTDDTLLNLWTRAQLRSRK